jgi:D-glycero-alpha-D-manno-heptose-7-phosphate kinase
VKSITVTSPTRVDLAGGTLDLWPLYNFTGGATTVNVAIDILTKVEIVATEDKSITLVSEDLNLTKSFKNLQECLADPDKKLDLLRAQLQFWQPQVGFKLTSSSKSPVGGGLGGSSSLTISLLKAFGQFLNSEISDVHQMVEIAHNIEAQVLNTPTGTQDYYPAASGGINILTYSQSGISQKVLNRETEDLAKNFLLVYTGKAHHSGLNNFEVLTKAVRKDADTTKALHDLKRISEETAQACEKSQWSQLPGLFRQEYQARIALAPAFSSPEIEKLSEVALQAGAEAVKICGAGGGGCVLLWAAPQAREKVANACQSAGFQVLSAKPVKPL